MSYLLLIDRTAIIGATRRGLGRVIIVRVVVDDFKVKETFYGFENGGDPDKMPCGEYDLVMATMRVAQMEALWLEGTELFGHPANTPNELKGCWTIGLEPTSDGVNRSRAAFHRLFEALGGFREGRKIRTRVREH